MWFLTLFLHIAVAYALPSTPLEEDVILVRDKREPARSFMFSGWMPGSGMSTFASTGDSSWPYPRHRGAAKPPAAEPWGVESEEHPPPPGPAPAPGTGDESWQQGQGAGQENSGETEEETPKPVVRPPKKHKKKVTRDEDEEEYERPSRRGSGGNAAASFNAWFPIMLGMYPPSGEGLGGGAGRGGHGQTLGSGTAGGRDSHTTVIANSVSHGAHGIASSHATLYGGSQQQQHQQQPYQPQYQQNQQQRPVN